MRKSTYDKNNISARHGAGFEPGYDHDCQCHAFFAHIIASVKCSVLTSGKLWGSCSQTSQVGGRGVQVLQYRCFALRGLFFACEAPHVQCLGTRYVEGGRPVNVRGVHRCTASTITCASMKWQNQEPLAEREQCRSQVCIICRVRSTKGEKILQTNAIAWDKA